MEPHNSKYLNFPYEENSKEFAPFQQSAVNRRQFPEGFFLTDRFLKQSELTTNYLAGRPPFSFQDACTNNGGDLTKQYGAFAAINSNGDLPAPSVRVGGIVGHNKKSEDSFRNYGFSSKPELFPEVPFNKSFLPALGMTSSINALPMSCSNSLKQVSNPGSDLAMPNLSELYFKSPYAYSNSQPSHSMFPIFYLPEQGASGRSAPPLSVSTTHQNVKEAPIQKIDVTTSPNSGAAIRKESLIENNSLSKVEKLGWEERMKKIQIYREKRSRRVWTKKVSYYCRKRVADSRQRINGRFIPKSQEAKIKVQAESSKIKLGSEGVKRMNSIDEPKKKPKKIFKINT